MINEAFLKDQINLARKNVEEFKNQNRIFEKILNDALKGAPEKDKKTINQLNLKVKKVMELAKQGKMTEAQTLINELQSWRSK